MMRRASLAAFVTVLLVLAFGRVSHTSAPIKLARHPDYHAGKIAFSYLGDIWVANEDGTGPQRLTDHRGHEMYPRFSPDGRWIAFSSNRYGNNDVFVVAAAGGSPRRLTFHTGNDEVVGWTRDSQHVVFRAAHGDGAFPNVATLYQIAVGGGQEEALPVDWGYWGSFSPDGKSLVFNRHPAVWTRQHYRGSFAADLWIADLASKTYTKLLPDERYNRCWPMSGTDGAIYYVADPLPNDTNVAPGSAEVRKSANNIYRIPAAGGQPVQVTRHVDGNLFWLSMSSDGKVIVYEELFGIWKLDVATGKNERGQDRDCRRRKGQRERRRHRQGRSRRVRHLALGPARRDLGARPDLHHRNRPRRHHVRGAGPDGIAQPVPQMVGPRQGRQDVRRELERGAGDVRALENLVDEDELHTIMMMMMIGHLNASHTGVTGGPNPMRAAVQARYTGFDLANRCPGFYKVGHIYIEWRD